MLGESGVRIWEMPSGKLKTHDFNRLRYALVPNSDELKKLTPISSHDLELCQYLFLAASRVS